MNLGFGGRDLVFLDLLDRLPRGGWSSEQPADSGYHGCPLRLAAVGVAQQHACDGCPVRREWFGEHAHSLVEELITVDRPRTCHAAVEEVQRESRSNRHDAPRPFSRAVDQFNETLEKLVLAIGEDAARAERSAPAVALRQ
jgi:hypothetical protein